MLVSGGGVIQKKTARMRHDESRVSIRDTFWASHFLGPPSVPPSTIPSPSRVERAHIPLKRGGAPCGWMSTLRNKSGW